MAPRDACDVAWACVGPAATGQEPAGQSGTIRLVEQQLPGARQQPGFKGYGSPRQVWRPLYLRTDC
jgi:hypothetical protein